MKVICENCGQSTDIDTVQSYTIIDNVRGAREVICRKCYLEFFRHREVNHILRELDIKGKKKL